MKGNGRSSPKRLVDYVCLVGSRHVASDPPQSGYEEAELLRRFPPDDHPDFPLPSNIANFCQPEGHIRIATTLPTSASSDIPDDVIPAEAAAAAVSDASIVNFSTSAISPSEVTTFVFTLTDKDSNVTRFAVCHNFYRHLKSSRLPSKTSSRQRNNGYRPINNDNGAAASDEDDEDNGDTMAAKNFGSASRRSNQKTSVKHYSLTSICIISHFQFFSNFKECALALKRLVTVCSQLNHPSSIDHRISKRLHAELDAWNILLHLNLKPSPTLSQQQQLSIGKQSRT